MLGQATDTGYATLIIMAVLYFVPTIVAYSRKVPNMMSVIVVNVFLGWTFIGWVVALAMAARSVPKQVTPMNTVPRRPDAPSWPTSYKKARRRVGQPR